MVAIAKPSGPLYNWSIGRGYASGYYYPPTIRGMNSVGTRSLGSGVQYFLPFVPDTTKTFAGMAIYNTSTSESGQHARLGVYTSLNGIPNALLADAGEITLNGSAAIRDLSASITLSAEELYYLSILTDALTVSTFSPPAIFDTAMRTGLTTLNVVANHFAGGFSGSQAYGALPSTPPSLIGGLSGNIPIVCMKG